MTWGELIFNTGIKMFYDHAILNPSRYAMEETVRRLHGVGPLESADPRSGTPFYYIPPRVPGVYFRSGTVGRPGGGK